MFPGRETLQWVCCCFPECFPLSCSPDSSSRAREAGGVQAAPGAGRRRGAAQPPRGGPALQRRQTGTLAGQWGPAPWGGHRWWVRPSLLVLRRVDEPQLFWEMVRARRSDADTSINHPKLWLATEGFALSCVIVESWNGLGWKRS